MGPHPCGCGGNIDGLDQAEGIIASMGPHPCGCGGDPATLGCVLAMVRLQWGRIHADAEGRAFWLGPNHGTQCFNGAASMRMRRAAINVSINAA